MRHIILNVHGIGEPREREPGESRYWISPDFYAGVLDLLAAAGRTMKVGVTFDDGNASDLLIGAEGLARHGMTACFFPLSDRLDTPGNLSRRDLAALAAMGHAIGSHGAAHLDWRRLDAAGLDREFDHARRIIAEAAGRPVTAAAIPFGSYDRHVLGALARRGYGTVYSSDGGPVLSRQQPLPRTSLHAGMTLADVEALLAGPEPVRRRLRRGLARLRKRWI
jgi:peptidoglycan/xylan/chitin deacetylase (PgdA/CDA1 family)